MMPRKPLSPERAAELKEYKKRWAHERHKANPEKSTQAMREWRRRNPERARETPRRWREKNLDKLNTQRLERLAKRPESDALVSCRSVAKRLGLPFNLELGDIKFPTHCPVLGIELDVRRKGSHNRNDASPSVDRIIPAKGYTKGNVIVVSWRANRLKNNATPTDMFQLARFYCNLLKCEMPLVA